MIGPMGYVAGAFAIAGIVVGGMWWLEKREGDTLRTKVGGLERQLEAVIDVAKANAEDAELQRDVAKFTGRRLADLTALQQKIGWGTTNVVKEILRVPTAGNPGCAAVDLSLDRVLESWRADRPGDRHEGTGNPGAVPPAAAPAGDQRPAANRRRPGR